MTVRGAPSFITTRPPGKALWRVGDPYPADWYAADLVRMSNPNPNVGEILPVVESIRVNGWFGVLGVQAHSVRQGGPRIIRGNHRYAAGLDLGMAAFPMEWEDLTDEEGDRILIVDNESARLGHWDTRKLLEMLEPLPSLEGTGFTMESLESLQMSLEPLGDPLDQPSKDGGGGATDDVRCQIGTVSWTVTRAEYDGWHAGMTGDVGTRNEDLVAEIRGRLEI